MRDIPIFDTEFGVASLILKEIPQRETAYIILRDSLEPEKLLEECFGFCRAAGAERIYAAGHECLENYPLHSEVYEMRGTAWVDRSLLENLFPVTQATVSRWRAFYNEKMRDVDNAATLSAWDEKKILNSNAYFIHHQGQLLGIGWLEGTKLLAVAAEPGMGARVMHTMMSLVEGSAMFLEVASTNVRAIRLYERLGFLKTALVSRWYRVC